MDIGSGERAALDHQHRQRDDEHVEHRPLDPRDSPAVLTGAGVRRRDGDRGLRSADGEGRKLV